MEQFCVVKNVAIDKVNLVTGTVRILYDTIYKEDLIWYQSLRRSTYIWSMSTKLQRLSRIFCSANTAGIHAFVPQKRKTAPANAASARPPAPMVTVLLPLLDTTMQSMPEQLFVCVEEADELVTVPLPPL